MAEMKFARERNLFFFYERAKWEWDDPGVMERVYARVGNGSRISLLVRALEHAKR